MKRYFKSLAVLLTAAVPLTGCSVQDSTQPAENSISAGPKSDGAVVKPKKGMRPGAPSGKSQ